MADKEWGTVYYRGSVKVGNVYFKSGSMTIFHNGAWHEVGDKALSAIKSMDFDWRNRVGDYRKYYYQFEANGSVWVLDFDVLEWAGTGIQPKETTLQIHLSQISPREVKFAVIYHPRIVQLSKINLEDLLKSSLYRMPQIAEDLSRLADWVHLMNGNYIVIFHDREITTRIDVIMSHSRLPFRFVVSYHIDKPYFSADLHVVTDAKSYFDTMVEPILDEYYSEIMGGGEK